MSSQTLHFPLRWILPLACWGCIFGSVQFICWLPNLACGLLSESQWELLVGSFLISSFLWWHLELSLLHRRMPSALFHFPELDYGIQAAWVQTWAFVSAVPIGSMQSFWEPCFLHLGSGVSHKDLISQEFPSMPKKEKLLCMSTEDREVALQLCSPFLENSSDWLKWVWRKVTGMFLALLSLLPLRSFCLFCGVEPHGAAAGVLCFIGTYCIKLAPVSELLNMQTFTDQSLYCSQPTMFFFLPTSWLLFFFFR